MNELTDFDLSADELAELGILLARMDAILGGARVLSTAQKRSATPMGDKSVSFCQGALAAMNGSPGLVPPDLRLSRNTRKLELIEALRPHFQHLHRISERCADTELALGSDVMGTALTSYNLLKLMGRARGLEPLRRELGARFARTSQHTAAARQAKAEKAGQVRQAAAAAPLQSAASG